MRIPAHTCVAFVLLTSVTLAQPAVTSPEVHPDGRITFRLHAPDATTVTLRGEPVPRETLMTRDSSGVWSVTTEPLRPDIYAYSFALNGVRLLDPQNPFLKYNLLNTENQVHVPGPAELLWEVRDVPRGRVQRHFYRSAVAGDDRDFFVYTPPGYDPAGQSRYPVLYLLHGYSDDATAWTDVGFAHVILDNLIARGQAQPMIVVMPLGYGTLEVVRAGWQAIRRPDGTRSQLWRQNVERFRRALLEEVLPQVESGYRTAPGRESRAIAGLSMGGTQSLFVGLNALDTFSHVAAFSSGGLDENFAAAYPALRDADRPELSLLWIACGVDDGLITVNRRLHGWLKENGIEHEYVETPGGHSFRVWRRYLGELAPLLFRASAR
jgi:enterochelin esterase-like enzyme